MTPNVSIKKGREFQILRGHPWLFSGSISQAPSKVVPGGIVDLLDCNGKFIARGYYNPECDIAVRILTLDEYEEIELPFFERRVLDAVNLRKQLFDWNETNMFRLINAEGDFLPGMIADVFGDFLVLQCHTAGADIFRENLMTALINELKPKCIVLRNDATVRKREGLQIEPPRVVYGHAAFNTLETKIIGKENNLLFEIDPLKGQKTGFFTDQRDKRVRVGKLAKILPQNSTLANCFSYSAAFSVYATAANPSLKTINVDESKAALDQARRNFEINNLDPGGHEFIEGDVFTFLAKAIENRQRFDFVILDPPAFAKKQKDLKNALRAYTKLNQFGLMTCAAGAYLMTCSCSGVVTLEDLEECLRSAAAQAGKQVQILEVFKQSADHPVSLSAPESQYLKVLLCRVL